MAGGEASISSLFRPNKIMNIKCIIIAVERVSNRVRMQGVIHSERLDASSPAWRVCSCSINSTTND